VSPHVVRPAAPRRARALARLAIAVASAVVVLAGCDIGSSPATPPIVPGAADAPREVNIVLKDYQFIPPVLDLAPGETVLFHIVNGGLTVHEAIIGDMATQDAWESAEAQFADPPPGPTPVVGVPAGMDGFRVVVESGDRRDIRWTVPTDIPAPLILGCHIPGHWAKGMQVPIRLVRSGASPFYVTETATPALTSPPAPTPSASAAP
jgi:uncharacterized cupredoxin-like copper-binding protein